MSILLSLLYSMNKSYFQFFILKFNKRLLLASFSSINNLTQLFDDVILKWKVCDVVFSSLWQAFLIVRDDSITSTLRMKKAKVSFVARYAFSIPGKSSTYIAIKMYNETKSLALWHFKSWISITQFIYRMSGILLEEFGRTRQKCLMSLTENCCVEPILW